MELVPAPFCVLKMLMFLSPAVASLQRGCGSYVLVLMMMVGVYVAVRVERGFVATLAVRAV